MQLVVIHDYKIHDLKKNPTKPALSKIKKRFEYISKPVRGCSMGVNAYASH